MRRQRLVIGWAIVVAAATTADAASGVTVQLFQFRPGNIAVAADTRVTWTNQDEIEHTITAGLPGRPDGAFDFTLGDKGAQPALVGQGERPMVVLHGFFEGGRLPPDGNVAEQVEGIGLRVTSSLLPARRKGFACVAGGVLQAPGGKTSLSQ